MPVLRRGPSRKRLKPPSKAAAAAREARPTQEMLRLVAEIDEFKGAWRALRGIAPERLTALRRVATIEPPSGPLLNRPMTSSSVFSLSASPTAGTISRECLHEGIVASLD